MPVTEAMRQAARREYWISTFATALDLEDDPCGVHGQGDLEVMADQALMIESPEAVETHTWLVIRFRRPGAWGWEALDPEEVPHGCVHTTWAPNAVLSKLAAVTEHRAGTSCVEVR